MSCIFCDIWKNKSIPKVYEDDLMYIIKDLNPQAKLHYLMIPKEHYKDIIEMNEVQAVMLGKCIKKLSTLVDLLGLQDGFRLISNKGNNGCQSVNHLHIHILGGEKLAENCNNKSEEKNEKY